METSSLAAVGIHDSIKVLTSLVASISAFRNLTKPSGKGEGKRETKVLARQLFENLSRYSSELAAKMRNMDDAQNFFPDKHLIEELDRVLQMVRELEALYDKTKSLSRTEKTFALIGRKSFNRTKNVQMLKLNLAVVAPSLKLMITLSKTFLQIREDTGPVIATNQNNHPLSPAHTFSHDSTTPPSSNSIVDRLRQSLHLLDYDATHKEYQRQRSPDSYIWFLMKLEYRSWRSGKGAQCLWCQGNPDTISTLTSKIVDELRSLRVTHAFVYMGSGVQSASAVVGTMLAQLLIGCDDTALSNMDRILEASDASAPPSIDILLAILKQAASDDILSSETVVLVDDWDVKNMDSVDDFIKILRALLETSWRLFITSCSFNEGRFSDSPERCLFDIKPDQVESIAVSSSRPERTASMSAAQFVLSIDNPHIGRRGSTAVDQPGQFLFSGSFTDIILRRISTEGVDSYSVVDQVLDRVELQSPKERNLARTVLIWLANVQMPLSIKSLCEALAVDHAQLTLNRGVLPTAESVIACCQGLTKVNNYDSTISLTHPDIKQKLRSHWSDDYEKIKADLSITCLVYVLLATFKDGPSTHQEVFFARFEEFPFLSYAADSWAVHARETPGEEVHGLVMELFNQPNRLASAMQMKERGNLSATSESIEFEAAAQRARSMSALQIAIRLGLRKFIHILLENQADVMKLDAQGFRVLDEALRSDDLELFQTLYEKAVINMWDWGSGNLAVEVHPCVDNYQTRYRELRQSDGVTTAVENGNLGALLALLIDGGDPNTIDERGMPALHLACQRNSADMVCVLLENGANINECDLQGRTALYEAVGSSNVVPESDVAGDGRVSLKAIADNKDHLVELLLKNGADPNTGDDNHKPLFAAVQLSDERLVLLLLKHGADLNARTNYLNPLFAAIRTQNSGLVEILLDHGADVNLVFHGRSALYEAISTKCYRSTLLLLDRGADANVGDLEFNPLYIAMLQRKVDIVAALLRNGAATEVRTASNMTPLHTAARLREPAQPDIVEQLLRYGADVDSTDSSGRTPLFYAICNQDFESTEILLDSGAGLGTVTLVEKKSPLHQAAIVGNMRIFQLLLHSALCVSSEDAIGMTPMDYAEQHAHDDIVRLIKEN